MKRKQKLSLSPENAARQREIARYLKRGLPLAGLLAAALFCGCDEQSGALSGAVAPVPPVKVLPPAKADPPDKLIEIMRASATGGIIALPRDHEDAEKPDNSGNENKRCRPLAGEPILPNRGEKRAAANAAEEVK